MAELDGSDAPGLGSIAVAQDPSGTPVVTLCGEIDISNAHEIGAELERIVGTGTRRLVVDMSALEFMDSSGIAMLLHAAARVDSIAVRKPSPVVRRIFEATGLEATLPIED
jgi:stage II sporulation protein AA (anti-sigma F factor antagonist)